MNKPITVGFITRKVFRLITASVLFVFVIGTFKSNAQTETILHSFVGYPADGSSLIGNGLVQGRDGNLYGTTDQGGTNGCSCGTVFRISPGGNYTNLYSFADSPDGAEPYGGLVQSSDGNFYGTTYHGGTITDCAGCGTVFRISSSGSCMIFYSFGSYPNDGFAPKDGLVQGSDGNLYGTTEKGGTTGYGTIFRISSSANETNLYSFGSYPDGRAPEAGLVQGSDGNFYGTSNLGGTNEQGSIFRIRPNGNEMILYSFGSQPNDGNNPGARLVQGSDGNFYGTTADGGTNDLGAIIRVSLSGSETILYSFSGYPNDGSMPEAGLVQGSDGNLYGTTADGGTSTNCFDGCGTVFRISPSGTYTTLYSFVGSPTDGANPSAGLVQGSDGDFYGTTESGGTNNAGTVFKLTVAPNPVPINPAPYPINQITNAQVVATNVVLSVVSIAGETYQLQFSSSLNPTNWVNVPGVSVTNSIGASLTLTNFGGAVGPQGFYRFDITP